jgi:hypothetical protein
MSIVTAVSAARPAQHVPEYVDPSAFAYARGDWGRASYATLLESASRPSRLAASGMAATETPLTTRNDHEAKRRLQVMEEVAARLAKLAESNRGDLAARALEALRQKLTLLKMQAMAAIMRSDRSAALALADDLEDLARAINAAERDCAAAGGVDVVDAVPILGPQTPHKDDAPPIAGESALELSLQSRPPMLDNASGDAEQVARAAAAVRGVVERSDLRELSARLVKHSSPLLPLFDTSSGPDAVANEAASLIRSLRRAGHRVERPHGTVDVGARMDASAIAASLGGAGLLNLAAVSVA